MFRCFMPHYAFSHFFEVSAGFLTQIGVSALVLDIDNTLVPYEEAVPNPTVLSWFDELRSAGISFAFVSNNNAARVERFNADVGAPAYFKSGKPGIKYIRAAMEQMGAVPDHTMLIGDQLFTDVWAGRRAGLLTCVVPPIRDKRDLFTRFKRVLERPIMRRFRKLKGEEG